MNEKNMSHFGLKGGGYSNIVVLPLKKNTFCVCIH